MVVGPLFLKREKKNWVLSFNDSFVYSQDRFSETDGMYEPLNENEVV